MLESSKKNKGSKVYTERKKWLEGINVYFASFLRSFDDKLYDFRPFFLFFLLLLLSFFYIYIRIGFTR